jgi:Zn-dependent protease
MKFSNNALSIGSVMGIPIRLHISLLIALPFIMTYFPTLSLGFRFLGAIGLFVSVALHELGHSVVARAKGSHIIQIMLYPFGGAAMMSSIPKRPLDEVLVAIAGPAVSLLLGVLGVFLHIFYQIPLALELGVINIGLVIFNLIPAFPMDGGRVFRALISIKLGRLKATKIAADVGKFFCFLFLIGGFFYLHSLMLAFIGGYLYVVGQAEYRSVQQEYYINAQPIQQNEFEVEVSPPPYASTESFGTRLRNFFKR